MCNFWNVEECDESALCCISIKQIAKKLCLRNDKNNENSFEIKENNLARTPHLKKKNLKINSR